MPAVVNPLKIKTSVILSRRMPGHILHTFAICQYNLSQFSVYAKKPQQVGSCYSKTNQLSGCKGFLKLW